jgi:transposase
MAISYRPYEPQQVLLLPASLQDWLPRGHLAYFISDTVDALDLGAFYARYAGGGARNQPFHPAMMVKLLVYGYATGVFSSRKMERRLHEDLAFRMLGAGNFPKHRTIRDFRAFHLKELSDLFVQVVKLAQEMGLVKLGTVAIDGTKIKANASRHKAMSYERMQQAEAELKAQIDALLERARSADAAEADEPERDIPAEIERREVRLQAITEARERLEKRQREADRERGRTEDDDRKPRDEDGNVTGGRYKREFGVPEPKAQDNFTDPDSRIMKRAGGGFDASYNAQTAVDDAAHIIVAADLSNNAADVQQLVPMLQAVQANTGELPRQGLADAGYRSEDNFEQLAGLTTDLVVAMGREGKQQVQADPKTHPHTAAMSAKLQTDEGKAAYRRRKWIAEPPNGWIKSVLGFRQFSLRGLHRVQAEFKLVCLALNLRRMGAMQAA